VFTFEHPNRAHCIDNTRSIRLVFECTPPAGTGKPGRGRLRLQKVGRSNCARAGLPLIPLHRPPQLCWRTHLLSCLHPSSSYSAVCHGFAGYFDAQLYKDVHLSTHPPTHTPNMFSWFPIYFPLRTPFYVPQGAQARQGNGQAQPPSAHCKGCLLVGSVVLLWAACCPPALPITSRACQTLQCIVIAGAKLELHMWRCAGKHKVGAAAAGCWAGGGHSDCRQLLVSLSCWYEMCAAECLNCFLLICSLTSLP